MEAVCPGSWSRRLRFEALENLMEVKEGKNIVLIGPPGSGKTVLCQNIFCEAMRNGIPCMYVSTHSAPQELIEEMRLLGIEERSGLYIFVDLYSWVVGETIKSGYGVSNLSDLAGLNVVLSSAADSLKGGALVIFDTISTLVNYNSEDLTIRFLRSHLARMKKLCNIGFYAADDGIHTTSFYNSLRLIYDGVLEFKMVENDGKLERFIRVHSLKDSYHDTSWKRFKIVNRIFKLSLEGDL
jgi:KaiC/GvpD/RAD55 family RecA-like ATPase